MTFHVRVAGTWEEVTEPSIRPSGSYVPVETIHVRVAGVWEEVFTATDPPLVSASANGAINAEQTPPSSVTVGVKFDTDGDEYEYLAGGAFTNVGQWLDQGTSAQVWVEFLRTGGTQSKWDNRNNSQRYNINVDINFLIVDTIQASSGGAETIIGTFRFWDAASGGNALQTTSSATWSARLITNPCPLCCFTPWTLITMANGSQQVIVDVQVGDMIKVEGGIESVTEVLVRENRPMHVIRFADDRILEASEDHPLYVDGKGYAAVNPIIEYKDLGIAEVLVVGDKVLDESEQLNEIVSIEYMNYPETVYTFSNSKFYANGMLVY